MQLSYIVLQVPDVDRVVGWYVQYLELSVISETRQAVVLGGRGGAALELRRGKPVDHPERIRLAFHVEDVKTVFQRMHDRRLPLPGGLKRGDFGRLVVSLKDPVGHIVDIFAVDPQDRLEELTIMRAGGG